MCPTDATGKNPPYCNKMTLMQETHLSARTCQELRSHIDQHLKPGDRLPSEKDLATLLSVSRTTVRAALEQLWLEGRVERRWGAGTFVRKSAELPQHIDQVFVDVQPIDTVFGTFVQRGHQVSYLDTACEKVTPPTIVRTLLPPTSDKECWRITRVIGVDGAPAMLVYDHIPLSIDGVDLDPSPLIESVTTLTKLTDEWGIRIERNDATVEAICAPLAVAETLGIKLRTPILRSTQTAEVRDGLAVAVTLIYQNPAVMSARVVRAQRSN